MMTKRLITGFMLLLPMLGFSQDIYDHTEVPPGHFSRVGKSGWQFLHLPIMARSAGMASVKTAVTDAGVNATFDNPANLAQIQGTEAVFSSMRYIADIDYMGGAVARAFGQAGVFGVYFTSLNSGDMIRTENNYQGTGVRNDNLGTYSWGDMIVGISYARTITDRLSIGANVGYIEEGTNGLSSRPDGLPDSDVKVNNWSMDFGVHFKTGFRSLRFAILARNLGMDKRYAGFSEMYENPVKVRMPVDFFMGVGYDFIGGTEESTQTLSGYLEAYHPNDNSEKVHAALEYSLMNLLELRGGYKFNYDEQGLTVGGGLKFEMGGMNMRVDYAYLDYGRLKSVNMFTVTFGI